MNSHHSQIIKKNIFFKKEDVVHVHNETAIKRNEIGSFAEMWMNLESVTQNEVSQKEKNKYYILTGIWGIS